MKILIKILLLIPLIILSTNMKVYAQFNKAGRTTYQFLKIGIGARASGMGEAVIANTQDINSVFWNPAAITQLENIQAAFNYTKWIADLNVIAGAVGYKLPGIGTIALNYIGLDYGQIQEALVTSSSGSTDTRTGNTFSGKDLAIGLAIAREFTDKLSIGINAKYLREDLYILSNSLWSFDVGTYYNTGWKGIRIAMTAQNFSKQARWLQTKEESQQSFELPLLFKIGTSIDLMGGEDLLFGGDPMKSRLSINIDAVHSNDYAERLNFGGEYVLLNTIALRAGYRVNYDEGNLALGIGLNTELSGFRLQFDYSYVKYDFLESPHRFTVMFAF
ncbi:MAG: PorV/PorQ family protein [Bacteroidota bacterium]|nr:PorV/PorQ family protein [Bacteroidota bacterium]MDP4190244.1 PorV/PorQ family protein [Bacteroidota bacterium]MDP4195562.1 PorV/PorQ family protein [Bacteroidota bacterium]